MAWWQQRGAPQNYVEVKVAGVELKGRRLDPFAVLFARGSSDKLWEEVARTETVWEDNNPAFVESFEVPFIESEDRFRPLKIVLYSKTSKSNELRRNTYLGSAEFTLDRMLSKPDGCIERILRNKAGRPDYRLGYLIICGEEIQRRDPPHMYSIQFGFGPNSKAWGPPDVKKPRKCFYVIYRAILNGATNDNWAPVYRSEIVDPYSRPDHLTSFEGASLTSERLYGMDENRGLRFELFHFNASGPHRPLGFVQTSAAAFKYAKPGGKLFMVVDHSAGLRSGVVYLDMLKNCLTTRKGGINSLFVFRAAGFQWGEVIADTDSWVDRDSYGRKVTVFGEEDVRQVLPKGIGYMGSRKKLVASKKELIAAESSKDSASSDGQQYDERQRQPHSG